MTLVEHVKECGCDACKAFDARRFDEMRSVVGHSASDFAVAQPLTADTITDEDIRELCLDSDPLTADGQRAIAAASTALYANATERQRNEARARCAEIWSARRSV